MSQRESMLDAKTIKNRYHKLLIIGSVIDAKKSGRPLISTTNYNVVIVNEMFTKSSPKSSRQGSRESDISCYSVVNIVEKDLFFKT